MKEQGFTFVEVVVVIGIFAILASLSYYFGLDSLRGYQFHAQKNEILSMLQVARQKSVSNENESEYGVRLESKKATLFKVPFTPGDSENFEIDLSGDVSVNASSLPLNITFEQLSGDSSEESFVVQNNSGKSLTVNINNEGAILW